LGTDAIHRSGTAVLIRNYGYRTCTRLVPYTQENELKRTRMDCGTKRDWSSVPKQYHCGSLLTRWQDYFGTDTVLEFLLGFLLKYLIRPLVKLVQFVIFVNWSRLPWWCGFCFYFQSVLIELVFIVIVKQRT